MKPKTVRNSAAKNTNKPAVVVDRPAIVKPAAPLPVPSALSKAPAPQAVVPPPSKPVAPLAKPVVPLVKSVIPPTSPVAPPVKSVAPVAAPVASTVQPALPKEIVTTVMAKIDVGFGNALYIRGQGDGLSWDKGTRLQCVDPSTWVWSTPSVKGEVVFKLLVNDEVWSQGEDLTVVAGKQIAVVPAF